MKIIDLYNINNGINKLSNIANTSDINFAMSIARISNEVSKEIEIINAGRKKPSNKYKEFLKEQQIINMKYAIQKEDGTIQTLNDSMIIREPLKYNKEVDELKEKYKTEIELQEKINEEFDEYLKQEFKGTITKIPKSLLPLGLTVEQVKVLYPVIND